MRARALMGFVVLLASCGVQQLNRNIEQNTQQMEKTSAAITENTREIERSTKAMRSFQWGFPFLFLFVLIPAYVLFNLYRKLLNGKKPLSKTSMKTPKAFLKELFLP